MQKQIESFYKRILRDFPDTGAALELFPTGAAMLDVRIGNETYVLEYSSTLGALGVSRKSTAVYGWEGFEHPFETFEAAEQYLLSLLKNR
jgi:hypothetical protein